MAHSKKAVRYTIYYGYSIHIHGCTHGRSDCSESRGWDKPGQDRTRRVRLLCYETGACKINILICNYAVFTIVYMANTHDSLQGSDAHTLHISASQLFQQKSLLIQVNMHVCIIHTAKTYTCMYVYLSTQRGLKLDHFFSETNDLKTNWRLHILYT